MGGGEGESGVRDGGWEWGWGRGTTPASALLGEQFSVHSKELNAGLRLGTGEKGQGRVWFPGSACCVR